METELANVESERGYVCKKYDRLREQMKIKTRETNKGGCAHRDEIPQLSYRRSGGEVLTPGRGKPRKLRVNHQW